MQELDDHQLLANYVAEHSGAAFAELVARYVNLVYSTGLRCTSDAHAAEEIAQAVFIILARKAPSLGRKTVLSGWLYHTTRLTAANHLRTERRRRQREQEAFMQSITNENPGDEAAWRQIAPLLDDALAGLGTADRDAVVLRFFENKSAREIAAVLRVEPATAHKRVERAVGKLRKFFLKRGVVLSATAIAGAVAANSVQAAPGALGKTISAAAIVKGATATASTLAMVKGVLKFMAWSNMKTLMVASAVALLAVGGTVAVVDEVRSRPVDDRFWDMKIENLDKAPPVLILRPAKFLDNASVTRTEDDNTISRAITHHGGLVDLIYIAYATSPARIILPTGIPDDRYDLMMTLRDHPREALQTAILDELGFTAERELVITNVFLLQVKDPALLAQHASQPGTQRHFALTNSTCVFSDYAVNRLAEYMEVKFNQPVEIWPGVSGNYDGTITVPGMRPGNIISRGTIKEVTAELNRMGLDLVLTNLPVEMLVVRQAK